MGITLSIVIPVVVIGYGVFLAVKLIRDRKAGKCSGGCGSCPFAESCHTAETTMNKENTDE